MERTEQRMGKEAERARGGDLVAWEHGPRTTQGQMVLSVFWALAGVGTMLLGLRSDLGVIRIAGLALVGVAVGKVFMFDLATLTSVYRVVSLVGLGLLLLGGALIWQRLRPRALTDLRETPAGVR